MMMMIMINGGGDNDDDDDDDDDIDSCSCSAVTLLRYRCMLGDVIYARSDCDLMFDFNSGKCT